MTTKNYAMLPVFAAILLIPQLLFWWLSPLMAVARLVIYFGATLINCASITTLFTAYWKLGLRKAAGLAVATGILETATLITCAILLAMNVTIRSAVYTLSITGLIHLIVLIPMVCSVFKPGRVAVSVLEGSSENIAPVVTSPENQTHPAVPKRSESNWPNTGGGRKALPPRNR